VKRAVEKGASCRRVVAPYEVSVGFVVKLMQRWREHGTLAAERIGGRRPQQPAATLLGLSGATDGPPVGPSVAVGSVRSCANVSGVAARRPAP
jgi:hypothetical protein